MGSQANGRVLNTCRTGTASPRLRVNSCTALQYSCIMPKHELTMIFTVILRVYVSYLVQLLAFASFAGCVNLPMICS